MNHSNSSTAAAAATTLDSIVLNQPALVVAVNDNDIDDMVSKRLRDIGFVEGEPVTLIARGLFGGGPLLAQIGYTRFALRRAEAKRIIVKSLS
ncbi:MAG: FeoA family protein [Candidatus Pacebacteria bacterium]|nr:FeoA family protein [Candidatus Paceibacterota bacterium]